MREQNIFYRVGPDNENQTTEMLANLLQAAYIRRIFLEKIGVPGELFRGLKYDDIQTQNSSDAGRPDIVIENDQVCIWIENKIKKGTVLQQTQTTSYIEELQAKGKLSWMIYLVPNEYLHESELVRARDGNEHDNLTINIVYWEELFSAFRGNQIEKWNPVVADIIDCLEDIVAVGDSLLTFSKQELIMLLSPVQLENSMNAINTLSVVIQSAYDIITTTILKDVVSHSSWAGAYNNPSAGKLGKWLNVVENNEQAIFSGFDFEIIKQRPDWMDCYFSVSISNSCLKCVSWPKQMEARIHKDGERTYYGLDAMVLSSDDAVGLLVEEISSFLKVALGQ